MLKQSFAYIRPVVERTHTNMREEMMEMALVRYEEGKPIEALHALLDYFGEGLREKYGNAEGTEFHIPHGSILVHIRIIEDRLEIYADFLSLPEKNKVAMLRQVMELNTRQLMLARFELEGNSLKMEYHCPLELTHPNKISGVLENICMIGDKYDDEFCTKFGAERSYTPQITPYPQAELDRIYDAIQSVCRRALEESATFTAEREPADAWVVLAIALRQIIYFARPQGALEAKIDEAIREMGEDKPTGEVVVRAEAFFRELMAMSREEIAKSLYYVELLASPKNASSLQNIQENLSKSYQNSTTAIQERNYQECYLRAVFAMYTTYYYNDVQKNVNDLWAKALEESGDQPIADAAKTLYAAYRRVMETSQAGDDDVVFVNNSGPVIEEEQSTGIVGVLLGWIKRLFS